MNIQEELTQLTEDLIRFRTVDGNDDAFAEIRAFIKGFFEDTGLTLTEYEHNGKVSMLFTKSGNTNPKVLLYGHTDVVDGTDDQFIPKKDGDRLYGRGAMDMKSGLASMMMLMKENVDTDLDIGLLIVPDEEVGGHDGVVHVLGQGLRPDVVIMPDGGDRVDRMITKEKGIVRMFLTAHGTPAHGSRPWVGDDAYKKLMHAITAIETIITPLDEHPEDHWATTFVVGTVNSGTAVNAVPHRAIAGCDIRVAHPDTPESITLKIQEVLPEGVEMKVDLSEEGMVFDDAHPYVSHYRDVLKVHDMDLVLDKTHGTSDARHFSRYGIPSIQTQPLGGNLHGNEEWVSLSSIHTYYQVVADFLQKIA